MQYQLQLARVFVYDWERALAFYTETLGMPVVRGARLIFAQPLDHFLQLAYSGCPEQLNGQCVGSAHRQELAQPRPIGDDA